METLKIIDTSLFLILNGMHNDFFDFIMYWASNKYIWIPLYLFVLFIVYKEYKKPAFIIFVVAIVLIIATDELTSAGIKNLVKRPRPSHEASIADSIHLVKDYHGGQYGFPSSHAANSFALSVFIFLLLRKRYPWIKFVMFHYAILVSYSRIYLGVHYPSDVLGGIIVGSILGIIFYELLKFINKWRRGYEVVY
jgi:undecaprenyl-diphosphatase